MTADDFMECMDKIFKYIESTGTPYAAEAFDKVLSTLPIEIHTDKKIPFTHKVQNIRLLNGKLVIAATDFQNVCEDTQGWDKKWDIEKEMAELGFAAKMVSTDKPKRKYTRRAPAKTEPSAEAAPKKRGRKPGKQKGA